jgi:hypothetical protein
MGVLYASENSQQNLARLSKIMKMLDSCSDYNGSSTFFAIESITL